MTEKPESIFDSEMMTLLGEPLDPILFNLEQYSEQEINDLIEQATTNIRNGLQTSRDVMNDVDLEFQQVDLLRAELLRRLKNQVDQ